eukprot:scaffold2568_cov246-Pinguiococcus_pyrenoidosus.AAC.1
MRARQSADPQTGGMIVANSELQNSRFPTPSAPQPGLSGAPERTRQTGVASRAAADQRNEDFAPCARSCGRERRQSNVRGKIEDSRKPEDKLGLDFGTARLGLELGGFSYAA